MITILIGDNMKKRIIKYLIIIILVIILIVLLIDFYVCFSTRKQIVDKNGISDLDCIIVLGAGVWGDKPSPMLEDRINAGVELYKNNVASKIIMSGDHGQDNYDEVNIMKEYAILKGVSSEDIFMDHAGFSTYESIYRAKYIFKASKIVIVTQRYHLYRALYIANKLGLEAYGFQANPRIYSGQTYREIREILARNKDFIYTIIKPKPTYLGEEIPISGDGNITNDKEEEK